MVTTFPDYAVNKTLSFFRDNDWSQEIWFETGSEVQIDLTGCSIVATATRGTRAIPFIVTEVSLAEGKFTISLPRETTVTMLGTYNYDIKITDSNDIRLTRIYGDLVVKQDAQI